jgi:hypothetical protein
MHPVHTNATHTHARALRAAAAAAAATAATAAATTQEEREMRAHIPAHTHCCKSVRAHGWQLLVVGHFVFRHPRFRDPDPPPPVKFITRLLYRRCILSATLCA